MALDPNIILQAGNFKTPDYGDMMERRAMIEARNAQAARVARTDVLEQSKRMRLGEVGTLAAKGDYEGAKAKAAAAGDFDVLEHIKGLENDHRTELARRIEVAAPLAFEASKMPYEQRRGFIQAQTPRLVANGWKPEEIAGLDPTDQALGSIVASAQSIGDMLKRQDQQAEFADKRADRAADREFTRGNAFIAAGIIPPGAGGTGGAAPAAGGGATAGRTQFGWTPRARHGGDNTDAAVDGKIMGMAKALGVDPDAPLTGMTPMQIAGALTLSEGGPGSLADRNNNPGNLINPKTGGYQKFPTKAAGLQAAAAQVKRNLARGQTTIRTMVEGLPVGGGAAASPATGLPPGYSVIPGGKLDKLGETDLSASALERAAVVYGTTGQMPTGLGRQGVTQKAILNKWDEIASKGGTTPQEQVANWQSQKAATKAVQAFASGPQGNTVRSLNVAIDHLDTLQNAAQALQNGNVQIFNKVAQQFGKATGRSAPTNFEAVRGIVADEVTKAIIGGGSAGALADREEMKKVISAAQSPQQLAGVIAEIKKLMGGQLGGLRDQYRSSTGRDDFDGKLSQRTRHALGVGGTPKRATLSANVPTMTPEQARNAPKGTRFRTTDGRVMVRQ